MTSSILEVPSLADLTSQPVDVALTDEPGVVAVTAHADDGDAVTITWDEFARSVTIRWVTASGERLRLERELATRVSIIEINGTVEFHAWLRAADLGGELLVQIADKVSISDAILRM